MELRYDVCVVVAAKTAKLRLIMLLITALYCRLCRMQNTLSVDLGNERRTRCSHCRTQPHSMLLVENKLINAGIQETPKQE